MPDPSRIDSLVAEILAATETEGPAALDRYCAQNPDIAEELRSRLHRLLAHGLANELPALATDRVLGNRYRVRRVLGAGGMGQVFLAEDLALGRQVALKRLRPLHDEESLRRFERETKIAAGLEHPGIVRLWDVERIDGHPIAVMEFVPGCDLGKLLEQLRGFAASDMPTAKELGEAWSEACPKAARLEDRDYMAFSLRVTNEIAEALAAAHGAGVVHRDLKPSNILLDHTGRARLCDFGLASLDDGKPITGELEFLGTAPYSPPEQIRGEPPAPSMDVYSLGATLYELLTLAPPFTGKTTAQIIHQVATKDPIAPRRRNPAIAADAEAVCLRALRKRPADRYPNIEALASDLHALTERRPTVARPLSPATKAARSLSRHRQGFGIAAATGASLLLLWLWGASADAKARRLQADAIDRFEQELNQLRTAAAGDLLAPQVDARVESLQRQRAALARMTSDRPPTVESGYRMGRLQEDFGTLEAQWQFEHDVMDTLLTPSFRSSSQLRNSAVVDRLTSLLARRAIDMRALWQKKQTTTQVREAIDRTGQGPLIQGLLLHMQSALFFLGRAPEARKTIELLRPSRPELVKLISLVMIGRNARAADLIMAMDFDSQHPVETYSLAKTIQRFRRPQVEEAFFSKTLRIERPPSLYLELARIRSRPRTEQPSHFATLTRSFPNRMAPWSMRAAAAAKLFAETKDGFDLALDAIRDFARAYPNSAYPDLLLAQLRQAAGEQSAAIQTYRAAVRKDDTAVEAHLELGRLLPEPEGRIRHLLRAAEVDPWHYEALEDAAVNLLQRLAPGDLDQASECARKAITLNEDVNIVRVRRARPQVIYADIAAKLEQWDVAIRHWRTASALNRGGGSHSDANDSLVKAARMAQTLGRAELARDLAWQCMTDPRTEADGAELLRQLDIDPENPAALVDRAWAASVADRQTAPSLWSRVLADEEQWTAPRAFAALDAAVATWLANTESEDLETAVATGFEIAMSGLRRIAARDEAEAYWIARRWLSGPSSLRTVSRRIRTATDAEVAVVRPILAKLAELRRSLSLFEKAQPGK